MGFEETRDRPLDSAVVVVLVGTVGIELQLTEACPTQPVEQTRRKFFVAKRIR